VANETASGPKALPGSFSLRRLRPGASPEQDRDPGTNPRDGSLCTGAHAQAEANSGRRRDGQAMAVSRRRPAGISWPALSVT